MKLLDWRVSPDTPDSNVQVLRSVGVGKRRVPPEFPRSPGDMKSCEGWDNWIMGTSLCCGQGTWLSLCVSWLSICWIKMAPNLVAYSKNLLLLFMLLWSG